MITPWDFDQELLLTLNFDGGELLDCLMYGASQIYVWVLLYVFVLWLVWRERGRFKGVALFVAVVALMVFFGELTCNFFKDNCSKLRPTHYDLIAAQVHTVNGYVGGLYGTVSAHAANCMGFVVLTGGILRKKWVWWMLGAWCALVCYSRIYLGVHYPMDILFGLLTGTLWGAMALCAWRYCDKNWRI